MKPIVRSLLVESNPISNGATAGTFINLPDVPELRGGVLIEGVEVYTTDELAAGPSQVPNISPADALSVVLTLNELSTQRFRQVPLSSFISTMNAGIWKELDPFLCNWQASGLTVTGGLVAGAPFVVCLSVFFRKLTDGGRVVASTRPQMVRQPIRR